MAIHHEAPRFVAYRRHLGKGKVMKPSTFHKIEEKAMKEYHIGKARAARVAGAAYWATLESKYKKRHH